MVNYINKIETIYHLLDTILTDNFMIVINKTKLCLHTNPYQNLMNYWKLN
jgi:hypothetical protein